MLSAPKGFIPVGAQSRQEHLFIFFCCWKKKFVKIDFSSVAAKSGICARKIFIYVDLLLDMQGHNNKQKCSLLCSSVPIYCIKL